MNSTILTRAAAYLAALCFVVALSGSEHPSTPHEQASPGQERVEFSTFLGGEFAEAGQAIAVDADGAIYVAGLTQFGDFGEDVPGFRIPVGPDFDIFVAKLAADGSALDYVATIGGTGDDEVNDLFVDADGCAYLAGNTFSLDFPTTSGAVQTAFGGGTRDSFVLKLSPDGTQVLYATYLGGERFDDAFGLAVDTDGRAFITGTTGSDMFPVTSGALRTAKTGDLFDGWVGVLSPEGDELLYASYLGGSGRDEAFDLALTASGELRIVGATSSLDFPVTDEAVQQQHPGLIAGFVMSLSGMGSVLDWATFLGGAREDRAHAVDVAPDGSTYVAGRTLSLDLITTGRAVQTRFGGGGTFGDAFAAGISPDGTRLIFSTYLGGQTDEDANAVAVGPGGLVTVAGWTGSPNFPVTADALQAELDFLDDAFVATLTEDGSELFFSTFLGGEKGERVIGIARGEPGRLYLTGNSNSPNFPTTPDALQPMLASGREAGDAFITKLELVHAPEFTAAGVVNGASFLAGTLSPGEIVSIFGSRLGRAMPALLRLDSEGRVATEAGDTRVLVNGVPGPVIFSSREQVSFVVPYSAAAKETVDVQVEYLEVVSEPVPLEAAPSVPAIFTLDSSGSGPGAILNQDSSVNTPFAPAQRGSVVQIFATGEGLTDPDGTDGKLAAAPLPRPRLPVEVEIGGVTARVAYAGGAPGLVAGVVQVNAVVPPDAPRGFAVPVVIRVGGTGSQPDVTLAVN